MASGDEGRSIAVVLDLFFFDLRERPWWNFHEVPSWRMIPCFGWVIVSGRYTVALALCLNHG